MKRTQQTGVPVLPCALVKWLDGAHANTFTHNVSLDWIHGINATSPEFPETYAVEWRVPPKPRNGWPLFDGYVIDISTDLEYLKSKADELRRKCDDLSASSSNKENIMDLNSQAFKDVVSRLVREQVDPTRSPSRSRSAFDESTSSSPPREPKICIGKSLCFDKTVHTLAINAASPGRMLRPLLRQAFSRKRLIGSSYAGQKRRVNGELRVKPSLKKYQKMADIHAFVLRKFPHTSQSAFGGLVNSFLGEKQNEVQEVQYVEDTDSEAE